MNVSETFGGIGSDPPGGIKFADDYIFAALQCSTQWDALSHAWYGEQLYNGVSEKEILLEVGRRKAVGGQEDMIVEVGAELAGLGLANPGRHA